MHHPTIRAVAVALLAVLPSTQAGLYTKNSPVLQVDAKDYDPLIANSKYTSIVEFYAPWCGHCQKLKPIYEKVARNLDGLAQVAAINCDDDANKLVCGRFVDRGFPTLKIFKPGNGDNPIVEDYNGPRIASDIVDAVSKAIKNYVKKVDDKNIDSFLRDKNETAKAILFTEKNTIATLTKGLAIEFLHVITFGQVRNTQAQTVAMFGIEKFPTLLLLPGGHSEALVYQGEIKKADMVKFLRQAGEPNTQVPPKAHKVDKKASSPSSSSTKVVPQKAPVIAGTTLPLTKIHRQDKLVEQCLSDKSHTCVLALVVEDKNDKAKKALEVLADLAFKHAQSKRRLFPFFEVPATNEAAAPFLKALELSGELEIVAINARRGWWRHYDSEDLGHEAIEQWIDAIRMGEGTKKKLPKDIMAVLLQQPPSTTPVFETESSPEPATPGTSESETTSSSSEDSDPIALSETAALAKEPVKHGEL